MSIFESNGLQRLKQDIFFLQESQKLTSKNIAKSNTPGAQPLKLERSNFFTTLNLAMPEGGQGINDNKDSNYFNTVIDIENQAEHTNGESRISIENESVRMAQLDDEHNLRIKLMSSWKKAAQIVMNSGA